MVVIGSGPWGREAVSQASAVGTGDPSSSPPMMLLPAKMRRGGTNGSTGPQDADAGDTQPVHHPNAWDRTDGNDKQGVGTVPGWSRVTFRTDHMTS